VEINGDTNVYYYNYRPTMYAVAVYDSTSFFTTWGTASGESKPSLANATEVWGNRKDIMQIKIVKNFVISAIITDGPDKKVFVRDLNGNIVLDPNSGYNPNISDEQKIDKNSNKEFKNAYNSIYGKNTWDSKYGSPAAEDSTVAKEKFSDPPAKSPWEDYQYRQQKSEERAEARAAEAAATTGTAATEATETIPANPNEVPAGN
jgi:hypothetical protein